MKTAHLRFRWRAVTSAAAIVLALGAVACGSDDGDGDVAGAQSADRVKQQIEAAYGTFVKAFYAPDPKVGCAALTPDARERFAVKFAPGVGRGKRMTCEDKFAVIDPEDFSKNKPYVVGIKLKGSEAIASVKTKNSNVYPVPFVQVKGEWKIDGGF